MEKIHHFVGSYTPAEAAVIGAYAHSIGIPYSFYEGSDHVLDDNTRFKVDKNKLGVVLDIEDQGVVNAFWKGFFEQQERNTPATTPQEE